MVGGEVFLKCENLQRAGSFKVRGAYVRMAKLSADEKKRGVVAASAGNHAQGVAVAAKSLGIKARIYMPLGVALPKLAATRSHGAEVVLHGHNVDEALAEAKRYADETGAVFVHPFDDVDVVAGQGTVGLEILEQVPDVDTILMGVGGGGLLAGVAVAVKARAKELGREIRIIGVQAENAAAYPPSLAADALVPLKRVSTMADGIAVGRPGQLPFSIIRELVDDVVTVSEDALARALIFLLERAKMVVEPAGAVGVAALMEGKIENPGTVAVVLSGGNIDPMLMLKVIQRGLSAAGRYMTVRMMLDDRPGSLATIARIIAENDANVTGPGPHPGGRLHQHGRRLHHGQPGNQGPRTLRAGPRGAAGRGLPADRGALGAMVLDASRDGSRGPAIRPRRAPAGACWWWARSWCCCT